MCVVVLARLTGVKLVEFPAEQFLLDGQPVGEEYHQSPVIGQLAATIFADVPILFYLVTVVTGLILVLAANTAFNGFPSWVRSWPGTSSCRVSCTHAATGLPTPTAS